MDTDALMEKDYLLQSFNSMTKEYESFILKFKKEIERMCYVIDNNNEIYVEIVMDVTEIYESGILNWILVACKNPEIVEKKITDV